MRVPPKLMAGARRGSRARGKLDAHRRGRGRARLYARARPAERSSGRPRAGDPPAHRPPRGSRRRAHPHPAAPALAPARARASARAAGGLSGSPQLARAHRTAPCPRRAYGAGTDLSRARGSLSRALAASTRARARDRGARACTGASAARASRLRRAHRRQARRRDRWRRSLSRRRQARDACRRGAASRVERCTPASPPESLGQPSTQLCPASHRGYPGLGAPACPGLPRAQGERRALTQGSSALLKRHLARVVYRTLRTIEEEKTTPTNGRTWCRP